MPYKVFDQRKTILSIGLLTSKNWYAVYLPGSTNTKKSAEKESIQIQYLIGFFSHPLVNSTQ